MVVSPMHKSDGRMLEVRGCTTLPSLPAVSMYSILELYCTLGLAAASRLSYLGVRRSHGRHSHACTALVMAWLTLGFLLGHGLSGEAYVGPVAAASLSSGFFSCVCVCFSFLFFLSFPFPLCV